ncbi:MAG TPA: YggS family pyridoxal phosphate-dependent enzyme [Candidatus Nanopelagicales bacterium]
MSVEQQLPDDGAAAILASLVQVRQRISNAAASAGAQQHVDVLLATKTVPANRILIALRAGYSLIGENRVQELVEKSDDLAGVPHEAHFIGHLQKNKINQVLRHATCIQSVDSVELADQILARLPTSGSPFDLFVQVNTSGEQSKYGCAPGEALALAQHIGTLPALHLRGFMTIGLFSDDLLAVAASYRRLRETRDAILAAQLPGTGDARELSMGMSGDLELAVAEGATMIRVGTAVFGSRATPDSLYWPDAHGDPAARLS